MKWLTLLLALMLTACAGQTERPAYGGESNLSERARIHTELGAGYYAQNQLGIALEEFKEAVQIDPSYSLGHNGLGLVYAALREDAKADASFKKAIELAPNNSESRNNYGTFLCSRGRYDESITQFLEAVKNPLYVTPGVAYMNAGVCSLRKKDVANAEVYLQRALQVQPVLYQASYQLAQIEYDRGQPMRARQYLQTPLANDPTAEMLWLGIKVERLLGGRDAEASYALQLRKKYPNSEQTKALLSGQ
ncbi:MAG TPA: type IV pilus biogenesis/stability protein PilW [Methylophilaceae bacterium]|nr:type IV pilus biogenesis/stability protein PilW [Methylophilaceae bacterium]